MEDKRLVCMNDGRRTRYNSALNTETTIVLTLISCDIAGIRTWNELNKSTVVSDHYPIITKVGVEMQQEGVRRMPKWKLKEATRGVFETFVERYCERLFKESFLDADEYNNELATAITKAAEGAIQKSTGVRQAKVVPWWNNSCRNATRARH